MNSEKPSWSEILKASSYGKGVFSEEMKQSVMKRAEQSRGKNRDRPLFPIVIPLMVVLIGLLIVPLADGWPAGFRGEKIAGDVNAAASQQDHFEDDVILHYEPAQDLAFIPDTDKAIRGFTPQRLPMSSVQINEAVTVDGVGKYLDYTKSEDSISYFGFQLAYPFSGKDGEFFEIGYGKMSEVNFQPSDAFGLSDLRLDGKCGPHRRCAYWISVNQDKVTAYEQMDASTIYEQDLDGDGVTEAIVLTDARRIYIYKNRDGRIESVEVQAALKADYKDTVTYDPENQVFVLSSKDGTKSFRYAAGADKLVAVRSL